MNIDKMIAYCRVQDAIVNKMTEVRERHEKGEITDLEWHAQLRVLGDLTDDVINLKHEDAYSDKDI